MSVPNLTGIQLDPVAVVDLVPGEPVMRIFHKLRSAIENFITPVTEVNY